MSANAAVAITTLFSPYDDTEGTFLEFCQGAQKSLDILIYGFHLPKLTDLLIAKQQAGIKISLILDHSQEAGRAESGEVQKLIDAGVPLLVGTSSEHHQILHSKFTVVDKSCVEFGSWNYSTSASWQSNTMSFVDNADYAQRYLEHHDDCRKFIIMREKMMQPARAIPAGASLPDAAPVAA